MIHVTKRPNSTGHCATLTKRYRYRIVLYRVVSTTHKLFPFDRISNWIIKNCMNTINYVCSIYGKINCYCHSIVFIRCILLRFGSLLLLLLICYPLYALYTMPFHDYCMIWNFDRSNAKYGFWPTIEIWTSNMLFALRKMIQVVFIKQYCR